ncbi:NADP-dependent oxidoreductase [Actinokineospora bangkokensis]|uniref:NADPH:quinone reductase n=1 Tax=Actinokineospora bangkokensis TaxID=1193682 RepID=A0A1Q9LP76_9PSEU|nr:NADP-dependent oxidoreductase [Actinokineospora bangkokensis]OLR93818.1 NADPH:quinone reductase [Actinokineospora bangkokensis]
MFALRYHRLGGPDVLGVDQDVPEPHPGPGQVRVRVAASGVTPADWYLRTGRLGELASVPLPHIPGIDGAGVVDELGAGVEGVAVGDEVFGVAELSRLGGTAAQFAVLAHWAPRPAGWSWEQAGGAGGNVETATRVLDLLGVGAGHTLLVEGAAGGVGTMAVQLAVARGAKVIGTAREPNHDLLVDLGAIPTTYGPGLAGRVAGHAVDFVLDAAGSGSLPELVAVAGDPARVVSVADFTAPEHGVHLSAVGSPECEAGGAYHGLRTAVELAGQGRLRVPVAAVFPFARAGEAHALSESRRVRGKVVLVP